MREKGGKSPGRNGKRKTKKNQGSEGERTSLEITDTDGKVQESFDCTDRINGQANPSMSRLKNITRDHTSDHQIC